MRFDLTNFFRAGSVKGGFYNGRGLSLVTRAKGSKALEFVSFLVRYKLIG